MTVNSHYLSPAVKWVCPKCFTAFPQVKGMCIACVPNDNPIPVSTMHYNGYYKMTNETSVSS